MKKNLKKKLSKNKAETFKTGGGAPKIQELTSAEDMLLSFLPSTIQGLPSVFDSDETFDKKVDYENTEMETCTEDNVDEIDDGHTDQTEWLYEILDDNNEAENASSFKHANDESTKQKRVYLEQITNTLDKYPKKAKTLDVNDIIEKADFTVQDENCAPPVSKKLLPSETIPSSSGKQSQAKDVLKKTVSKELKVGNISKSFEKNDIVKLAIAKEELVQLQKTALELDIRMKEENNNTQKEIIQSELQIVKEKLKLIQFDVQLRELEVEIKRQQLLKLL